jgi:hypothetical protein
MIVRWTATALREASAKFRRIAGHKGIPMLVGALRAHDAKGGADLQRRDQVCQYRW